MLYAEQTGSFCKAGNAAWKTALAPSVRVTEGFGEGERLQAAGEDSKNGTGKAFVGGVCDRGPQRGYVWPTVLQGLFACP